jgi:hypothetical protein
MLIAEINRGNIKTGIKYIPAAIIASLFIYEVFMRVFSILFSGLTF